MKFELPPLPFAQNDLAPHMSAETLNFHYGKHHKAYVDKLNALIQDTAYEDMVLEDIILNSVGAIYNNAAQTWNHTFYFFQFSASPKRKPEGELLDAINGAYGQLDAFKVAFESAALSLFGSGWVWMVKDAEGRLDIRQTANALNPMSEGETPLMVCDVWEHAYYLDYQNKRPAYIAAFWEVLDWTVIEKRFLIK